MNSKLKTIIISAKLILYCAISTSSYAQAVTSVKDTVYVFLLRGTLENDRPISSYAIVKDLSTMENLTALSDRDAFICGFFKNAILFEEPAFTLSSNQELYDFPSEKTKNRFFTQLSKKIGKLNKGFTHFKARKFINGRAIELSCLKMIGDFWVLPKDADQLNEYSHSFKIEKACYNKSYIYNLKDIAKTCRIKKEEIERINKAISE